jgi:cell division protein FtsW
VNFPAYWISAGLYGFTVLLLLLQPDVGMTLVLSAVWGAQIFLAGLPFILVLMLLGMAVGGGVGAYFLFDHVRSRIDRFLDPSSGDNYQVERSLEAFQGGGLIGKGPGEGQIKLVLPDSHTDFIFAVAGEELGLLACLSIAALFFFVAAKGMIRVWRESDAFVMIAVSGLLLQFSLQALINMGVAVQLLPAKGMTLPFLSYGGSSIMAIALAMGMMLGLTRKRFGKSV